MRKLSVFSVGILTLLLVATFGIGHAHAEKKVAGVHIVHPDEDLDAKARALNLPSYMDTYQDVPGNTFLVIPATAGGKLEAFSVEIGEDGKLHLGTKQETLNVSRAGEGFVLRHLVSEGMPNWAVCLLGLDRQRECWIPRFSGEDGSLILDKGFYPVREKGENKSKKSYSHDTTPLLTGPELIDQPQAFVERLKDANHLARLAAKYRFVPKGELKPEMPHHFLFVPLALPVTIKLHVMHNKAGDGTIDPTPVAAISLKDDEAAVFSLDLDSLKVRSTHEENFEYTFMSVNDTTGETGYWLPRVNYETGKLEGYGLGPIEKFMHWSYGDSPESGKNHTNSIGMEFVLIPSGTFIMGIENHIEAYPPHQVTINTPFYLGQYEVTQKQWETVMGTNPSRFKGATNPVENVSWDDAQTFIARLNKKEGHNRYRLPTEAEWEHAARAGTTGPWFFTDAKEIKHTALWPYAWFDPNAGGKTHPVGQKKPNPWGLYDIYGNVGEWVQDRWAWPRPVVSPSIDPQGPTESQANGKFRVNRGGSHGDVEWSCSSVLCGTEEQNKRMRYTGLRLALSLE